MPRLPALLTTDDLPLAELSALRCDGILTAVGSWYAPLDEPATRALRAAAAVHGLSGRLIAERMTAAWIWGAVSAEPHIHQFCTGLSARVAHPAARWLEVREVVLSPAEVADAGGVAVTTPVRTIVDLARTAAVWGERERDVVAALRELGRVHPSALVAELDRVNLPHKRRAAARLGISPS